MLDHLLRRVARFKRCFSIGTTEGSLDVYRAPDRLSFYRGFGVFCMAHTITWTGVTVYKCRFYPEKLTEDQLRASKVRNKALRNQMRSLIPFKINWSAEEEDPANVGDENTEPPVADSTEVHKGIVQTFMSDIRKISNDTKAYDEILLPIFTCFFGMFTFAMGFLIPRKIVRRITILPYSSDNMLAAHKLQSAVKRAANRLVEVETYGAFAMNPKGVTFRVPLSRIQRIDSRQTRNNFIYFRVEGQVFQFIIEKTAGEFPHPKEYDFMFAGTYNH